MKVTLSTLSICLISTICLGPGIAGGAQLLSDDDLDQVTAAGSSWSVDVLNPNLTLGSPLTTSAPQPSPALSSALASVSAAEASAEAARAVSGIAGLAVATDAVSTAATALQTATLSNGVDSLNAGRATLTAAASILNSIPPDQQTSAIIDAANKVNQAAASLNQAALNSKAIELNSAVQAVDAAKNAIHALPNNGGAVDQGAAIDAAVKSILQAKDAINAASQAQIALAGGNHTLVLKENGDGSLNPVLRINFNSGSALGSADIIPLVTRGGPSQPTLNLDGVTSASGGILPNLTLVAETLMMNMNICFYCHADKIIQNNNGYVVPIYTR